mmetsp:Transcript_48207/g.97327  ORF Transcript_48207/g.97327 Transcript_48207/m.97327 type:complete len:209 (-) Transcript_48207:982-1608(-)
MRASRSARACFSQAAVPASWIFLRTAVQWPSGGPGRLMCSSPEALKPAMSISNRPALSPTLSSFDCNAGLLFLSWRNFASPGFCSVLSSTLRAVLKKASCTSHSSAATRASAASAAASSMGSGSGPTTFGGGGGAASAAEDEAGAALAAAAAGAAPETPQALRQLAMSKLFLMKSPRPSVEMGCPVLPLRMIRLGMPRTLKAALSASF